MTRRYKRNKDGLIEYPCEKCGIIKYAKDSSFMRRKLCKKCGRESASSKVSGKNHPFYKNLPMDSILDEYNKGVTADLLAKKYRVTTSVMIRKLRDMGVAIRKSSYYKKMSIYEHYIDKIKDMYADGYNFTQISRAIGAYDGDIIKKILIKNGIKIREIGTKTNTQNRFRKNTKYINWRSECYHRDNFASLISGDTGNLNCHHIWPIRVIIKTCSIMSSPLVSLKKTQRLFVIKNDRLYDHNNGITITKQEHDQIEKCNKNCHPYYRIWKYFPEFALRYFRLTNEDYLRMNQDGMINPHNSSIIKTNWSDEEVKKIIRYEHYIGTIPTNSIILKTCVGNVITGIITFGSGANKNIKKDTIELTRLCVPHYVVRPFGINLINMGLNYIKHNYPNIKHVISFADTTFGHDGAIYRMSGWKKIGVVPPSYMYLDEISQNLMHKSKCRRIKGLDKTERDIASDRGWIRVPTSHKYKYIKEL